MAENSVWHQAAFLYLDAIINNFKQKILQEYNGLYPFSVIPLSLDRRFGEVLNSEMKKFNKNLEKESKRNDMVDKVKKNIEEVKAVVVENIEKVLERGEKIELLVDKTDRMQETAFKFESSARTLRKAMWWENVKKYLMLAGILIIVVLFLSATYCGGLTFQDCR